MYKRQVPDSAAPVYKGVAVSNSHPGSFNTRKEEAPCSYSPDGEYPVINLEKGGLYTSYSGTWEENTVLPCIRRIDSGTVGNAVHGKAEAVVEGISTDEIARAASAIEEQTGIAFRWEEKMGAL